MYNQGNYQQFGQRLPAVPLPPPPPFQQGPAASQQPPPPSSYLIQPPQDSNWNQNQHILPPIGLHLTPRIAPPYAHGQNFYSVPPPPASLGSFIQPPHESSLGQLPPPPPLSSSPPPLPPSPPSSVVNMVASGVNDTLRHETSVKDASDFDIMSDVPAPPPKPRDEKTVRKIEVLCQYIAKNGHEFEHMTCQKEVDNPDFKFLFGGEPGSEAAISHEYFKWMKKKCSSSEMLERKRDIDISLEPSGVGSSMHHFETQHTGLSHSPAGSDMDMEDDITQPEESGIGKSFGNTNDEPGFISNDVDVKEEEHACDSEHISHKDATDVNLLYTESSGVIPQEQHKIYLAQEMNQSDAAKVISSEAPGEEPFKLIQGYASDNSSESDDDPHFENISPVAVSPRLKEDTRSFYALQTDIESKDTSDLEKSKVPEPSTRKESLKQKTDSYLVDGGTCLKGFKQNDHVERDDTKNQKDDSNVKLEVDEFGRKVKADGSDSESDYNRRPRKRGRSRSRSRSRSPKGRRRRRSPLRRRERRSRSHSWSPKKRSRSRSRSPYRRRGDTSSQRNRNRHQPICHDFRLGKCFRGASCRYIHDTEKVDGSRHHRNRRHYQDRFKSLDKLSPEKDETDSFETQQLYEGLDKSSNKVNQELPEPSPHSTEVVASAHEPSGTFLSPPEPQLPFPSLPTSNYPLFSSQHPQLSLPPATLWNPLAPPPPRPSLPYQQNQPPFQVNYPFPTFIRPYPPLNYPISQQPLASPMDVSLISSNMSTYNPVPDTLQEPGKIISDFGQSRISTHYNPHASTFNQPPAFTQDTGTSAPYFSHTLHNPVGDQYDPLFDSINHGNNNKMEEETEVGENDEFGETADAEVGAVENDSPSSPIDMADVAAGDIEIDQVKTNKTKDSRSMKLFKVALAEFVKEVLKPSWRQGNMSKEAFKTIVKKTVDKVSGAMKKHQLPKSQAKINQYIDSSQRKLTKLVMGYVDKYVKV